MIFKGLETAVTGMAAQRIRIDISSSNLANINSTRAENGQPYRRKVPVFQAILDKESGVYQVRVAKVLPDPSPYKMKYDPKHPDAGPDGYVRLPNVDPLREMVDMMSAIRTYEANLTAFNTHKDMLIKSLELIRV
ncbi:flagellar basal body rod protein FlgC [Persephonella sp.]|uniref:flagellar basal body rod protein FlgC n=1 Tax=Persephonella sp. TaxID=2060922 RepID=UPI0025F655F2|nr:flagellar basal body rod protein FlgC [Persephonella sp.]